MQDGPDYDHLFRAGILHPELSEEHRQMVLRFLTFYKNTSEYEHYLDFYTKRGLVMDEPKKEEIKTEDAEEAPKKKSKKSSTPPTDVEPTQNA